jgi:hypothetical protein
MMKAQMINIASQKNGSMFDGITYTVAIAMARPNKERLKISFQFIDVGLGLNNCGRGYRCRLVNFKDGQIVITI